MTRDVSPPTTTPKASASTTDSPSIAQNTLARSREPRARASRTTSHSPRAIRQIMNSRGPRVPAMATKKLCRITSAPFRKGCGPRERNTASVW